MKFYNAEENCSEGIQRIYRDMPRSSTDRHTIATFYRFFISDLLPHDIEKIIYLDSDIVVNLDINELWRVELGDKIFAVVPEIANYKTLQNMYRIHPTCRDNLVDANDYFNAGVLLMNLNVLRNEMETLYEGLKFIGNNPQYILLDQDVFNYCFSTRTVKLPLKFNRFVACARIEGESVAERKIYHYVSRALNIDMNDPFSRLWMDYFIRTPWFNVDSIGRISDGIQQLNSYIKNFAIKISAAMSGKTRAFFAVPADIDSIRKIFSIRDDEEIIPADGNESLKKLIDAMKNSRGRKIFFIVVPKFPFQILIQAGFVPGRDFVNGMEFLSEVHGKPLDSYPLIKSL